MCGRVMLTWAIYGNKKLGAVVRPTRCSLHAHQCSHSYPHAGGMGIGMTVHRTLCHNLFLKDPHAAAKHVWENSGWVIVKFCSMEMSLCFSTRFQTGTWRDIEFCTQWPQSQVASTCLQFVGWEALDWILLYTCCKGLYTSSNGPQTGGSRMTLGWC